MYLIHKPILPNKYQSLFLNIILCGIAFSLTINNLLLTISISCLFAIWVFSSRWNLTYNNFKNNNIYLFVSGIYLLYLIGLLYTTDFKYAGFDLLRKVPLLLFPLVISSFRSDEKINFKIIILTFTLGLFLRSFYSYYLLLYTDIIDIRQISGNISHIRLSVMIGFAIFTNLFYSYESPKSSNKIIFLLISGYLMAYLLILQSITGLFVFLISFAVVTILAFSKSDISKSIKKIVYAGILFIVFTPLLYISFIIYTYFNTGEISYKTVDSLTKNNNNYTHNYNSIQKENGNKVWMYICEKELEQQWNQRSNYKYNSEDKKKQKIKNTIIRYMSSKGLRKDSVGVWMLSVNDIINIESGIASVIYTQHNPFYVRIYQIIWEVEQYINGFNPAGSSVTQRFEYLKAGFRIFKENIYWGIGTGDIRLEFKNYYNKTNSTLPEEARMVCHNQLLTYLITFGLGGLFIIFSFFIYPLTLKKLNSDLRLIFLVILVFLAGFSLDFLENQIGLTFYLFFLLLLTFKQNNQSQTC